MEMKDGTQEKASCSQTALDVAERRALSNEGGNDEKEIVLCLGAMWNSKIRKTVANSSRKAGNTIHLLPSM